jgi:hypothetical protein
MSAWRSCGLDWDRFRELVGGRERTVFLNHAEEHGLIARAGVDRVKESVGLEFPAEETMEVSGRVAGKLASLAGLDTGEYNVWLCRDAGSVLREKFRDGVEPATPLETTLPLKTSSGGVLLWEAVEGISGRYHPVIECGSRPCLVDATLATGVRVYPRVEGSAWHMYFSLLNRWVLTPGTMGFIAAPKGSVSLECKPPSILELLYLEGVIDYYLHIGPRVVEETVTRLTGEYGWMLDKAGYTPITPPEDEFRAGIISLHLPLSSGELERLKLDLSRRNVRVGFHRKILRISPHLYNTREDLDPLLQSLP